MSYIFKFIYNSRPLFFIVFSVVEVVIIFIALSGISAPAQVFLILKVYSTHGERNFKYSKN